MSEEKSSTPKTCAAWRALLCWIMFCLTTGQLHTACRRDGEQTVTLRGNELPCYAGCNLGAAGLPSAGTHLNYCCEAPKLAVDHTCLRTMLPSVPHRRPAHRRPHWPVQRCRHPRSGVVRLHAGACSWAGGWTRPRAACAAGSGLLRTTAAAPVLRAACSIALPTSPDLLHFTSRTLPLLRLPRAGLAVDGGFP